MTSQVTRLQAARIVAASPRYLYIVGKVVQPISTTIVRQGVDDGEMCVLGVS